MSMQLNATVAGQHYVVRLDRAHNISIPVRFDDHQLSVFGAPPARAEPFATAGFVGDVNQGGSCNCAIHTFAPHTSGTHTECVGHIASDRIAVCDMLVESLIPATLITIAPEAAGETKETYDPSLRPDDRLLTRARLQQALQDHAPGFFAALAIRTIPNGPDMLTRNYDVNRPPFFSIEAIRYLVELGTEHLLVDIPSIDRLDDEGKLTNHHLFWGVARGSHAVEKSAASRKSITELIYIPDEVADGNYLLNLQVAPFMADAAPSRPLLYELDRA